MSSPAKDASGVSSFAPERTRDGKRSGGGSGRKERTCHDRHALVLRPHLEVTALPPLKLLCQIHRRLSLGSKIIQRLHTALRNHCIRALALARPGEGRDELGLTAPWRTSSRRAWKSSFWTTNAQQNSASTAESNVSAPSYSLLQAVAHLKVDTVLCASQLALPQRKEREADVPELEGRAVHLHDLAVAFDALLAHGCSKERKLERKGR